MSVFIIRGEIILHLNVSADYLYISQMSHVYFFPLHILNGSKTVHVCIYMLRLGSVSVSEGKLSRQANANTSQKGNYSNFRNEKVGYSPVEVGQGEAVIVSKLNYI